MRAIVFCAGEGRRLMPLTSNRSKPVVPFAGKPLASHILSYWAKQGVRNFVCNTFTHAEETEELLRRACPDLQIIFSREEELLGTGGGARKAVRSFDADDQECLIANGDTLCFPDLLGVRATHHDASALATLVLREHPGDETGIVRVNDGWITNILENPELEERNKTRQHQKMMFTGIQLLNTTLFDQLPEEGCIVRQGYIPWLLRGAPIAAHVWDGAFFDLGTPQSYWKAHQALFRSKELQSHIEIPKHPDSLLKRGISMVRSFVSSETVVGPRVRSLDGVVAWPGATILEDLKDCVVTEVGLLQIEKG